MLRDSKRRRYHHEDLVQQGRCSPLGRGLYQGQLQNEIYRRRLGGQFGHGAVEPHTRRISKESHAPALSTISYMAGRSCEGMDAEAPSLCSTTGDELLEVWYYGSLLKAKGEPQFYIIDSDVAPGIIVARDPNRGEEFVIFDGGRHGYNNMFCDEHEAAELENRPLKQYEIPASKLVLELGYNIDYEDEKEFFEVDDNDTVELINGERMPWEQVKRNGIDYIALFYVNEKGKKVQILDAELA